MNGIRFMVDDYDRVIKCVFSHDIYNEGFRPLRMEAGKLNSLVKLFADEYQRIDEQINEDNIILSFYDVDDMALTELEKISKEYEKRLERIREKARLEKKEEKIHVDYTCNKDYIKGKNKTVTRNAKRKTSPVVATISALALSTIILIGAMPKANTEIIEIKEEPSISYSQNIENDINKEFNTPKIEVIESNPNELNNQDTEPIQIETKEETQEQAPEETQEETISMSESLVHYEAPEEELINPFEVSTEDLTESDKYLNCKDKYYDLIEKYSKKYGVDPMVMLAIAMQERGKHSDIVDANGGLGLFQVQIEGNWNWDNKNVVVFNYDTNEKERITITKEQARTLEGNIKFACALFQNALKEQKYNIPRAIQSYNYGTTYMANVIKACQNNTGLTKEALSDPTNLIWINYRNVVSGGDSHYLENVLRYLPNETQIEMKKPDGDVVIMTYENPTIEHNMSR